MKTVLFLHGFFSSGNCAIAKALKEKLRGKARVISPDIPRRPYEALEYIHKVCDREKPDLIFGNSCGAFYAQILAPFVGVPALLSNPHFKMTDFLKERIGEHQYKSLRNDGNQKLVIDKKLIEEFSEVEKIQFDFIKPYYKDKIWGIFGEKDNVAHFEDFFRNKYAKKYDEITSYGTDPSINAGRHIISGGKVFNFPGEHTPKPMEIEKHYLPIIEKMLSLYPRRDERYFRHFKGGLYRLHCSGFDSETEERTIVYQALYGEQAYWVRAEKMFFENITRDSKIFCRFEEIEKPKENAPVKFTF